jgi:hypothetical protein
MPKILTNLRVDEISSVDRGAGEGVKIMLMKRNEDKPMNTDSRLSKMFSRLFGGGDNNTIIDKSVEGLAESISSILADDKVTDPAAALTKTFEQFGDHLKSTLTAGPAVAKKEGSDMDLTVLKKALGLADTATEADVSAAMLKNIQGQEATAAEVKKLANDLLIAKAEFTPAELEYYSKESNYDDEEKDEEGDGDPKGKGKSKKKKAFRLASHMHREATMKAAEPALPANIQKIMDDNAAMAKRIADLEAGGNLVALTKQATEAGLPESEGATIQKALSGDKTAVEKLLGFVKSATAAAKAGGVFKEFGTTHGTGVADTPYDKLSELAKGLQKADPKLSFPAAFAKVYEDPANMELVKAERGENRPN